MTGNRLMIAPKAAAPAWAGELLASQCTRCGAVSTHYLTCPSLRLPAGYRLSQDPGLSAPVTAGQQRVSYRTGLASGRYRGGPTGGPDHPDWPRPPQD
jgi:hypothetical protein